MPIITFAETTGSLQITGVQTFRYNKLALRVLVTTPAPARWRYTVQGKTEDSAFCLEGARVSAQHSISIAGLYALHQNTVSIAFEGEGYTAHIKLVADTTQDDFDNTKLKIDWELYEAAALEKLRNGWLVTNYGLGYDHNGDLRLAGLYNWVGQSLKNHGGLFSATSWLNVGEQYGYTLAWHNLLGEPKQLFHAPEGYGFHHDVTCSDDALYALVTKLENPTDDEKLEAHIVKYSLATGELLWSRDYSAEWKGATVLDNSVGNDVHFNSIQYLPGLNALLVNSRSTSTIFAACAVDGTPLWKVEDPAQAVPELRVPRLTPAEGPLPLGYPNGAHTVFTTQNEKYAAWQGENKLVLTVFNNASCLREDGSPITKPMEAPKGTAQSATPPSDMPVYALDLNSMELRLVDRLVVEDRSVFTCNINDNGQDFDSFYGDFSNYYLLNANGGIMASARRTYNSFSYRARLMPLTEIYGLLPR